MPLQFLSDLVEQTKIKCNYLNRIQLITIKTILKKWTKTSIKRKNIKNINWISLFLLYNTQLYFNWKTINNGFTGWQ